MKMRWLLPCVAFSLVGCSGDTVPVAPTDVVLPEAVAESSGGVAASGGNSGCYAVKFVVSGFFPDFAVTGDLVGTSSPVFADEFKWTGHTVANGGTAHWVITGGVLGYIEFDTTFHNRNILIDRPGSPATFFENTGKHRALAGVEKANLTYHGTFDALIPAADHDYQGVICP